MTKRMAWLAALAISTGAAAQTPREVPAFDLEHLTFNPAQQAGLVIGTGDLLAAGQFRGSLVLHYQHEPLDLYVDGVRSGAVVKNRLTAHLLAAYGITRWLEVGLQLPVVVFQRGDATGVATVESAAVGTPWLQARAGLLAQGNGWPVDLSVQLGLGLPIGSSAALSRDSSVGVSPKVGAGRTFGLFRVGAEVGALIRKSSVLSASSATVADEVGTTMQLGANLTTTNEGLRGELNLLGWVPVTHAPGSLELLLGARYPLGPVELFALAGPGFGRSPGTPAYRVMLGLGLTLPRQHRCVEGEPYEPKDCPDLDLDHDGVLNAADQCVDVPGLARLAGCPDPDTDGDGVLDGADKCPKEKGLASLAGCPDGDGDGLADRDDRCPAQKGPRENEGCPWPDTDGDGTLDKDDVCPGTAGPAENHGCPWPDTDGDGVLDKDDACPKEAGPAERKGCPVRDADGDTVPDELDNCPHEKGDPANQGCPKEKKQLVVITREKLVIKEKVFFDTGKSTIKPKSFPLLTQVAQVLVEHQELTKVVVEGHTDNVGKADLNTRLSQARAEAVRDFLVKHKVAPGRLEAKGYGPDRPADVNTTAAGRENNRRVEFVVLAADKEKSEVFEVTP